MADKKTSPTDETLKKIQKAQNEHLPAGLFEAENIINRRGFNTAYEKVVGKLYDEKGPIEAIKYLDSEKGKDNLYNTILKEVKGQAIKVAGLESQPAWRQAVLADVYAPDRQALKDSIGEKGKEFSSTDYQQTLEGMLTRQIQALGPLQTEFDEKEIAGLAKIIGLDEYAKDVSKIGKSQIAGAIQYWDQGRQKIGPGIAKKLGLELKDKYKLEPNFKGVYGPEPKK